MQLSAREGDTLIRDATPADAVVARAELVASISDLDHGNDPAILARWLSNKPFEKVAAWSQDASHSLLVAIEGKSIVAVGSVRDCGDIT